VKQLERRLIKLERAMPAASRSLPADPIADPFARIWTTLAIAGLGDPRPDEPLRQAWARIVDIVDRGRGLPQDVIAILGGSRAYSGSELDIAKLRDATNSVPAWLDSLACLNAAREALDWPLREVGNEAAPVTRPDILACLAGPPSLMSRRQMEALSDAELERLIAAKESQRDYVRAQIAEN
jgi:hypothetical protein